MSGDSDRPGLITGDPAMARKPGRDTVDLALYCDDPEYAARIDAKRATEDELRAELEIAVRRWDRVAKDCRALTAEVVAGLSTAEHAMIAVAGLPECQCGLSLGGGDASGSFITHALAVLAEERKAAQTA